MYIQVVGYAVLVAIAYASYYLYDRAYVRQDAVTVSSASNKKSSLIALLIILFLSVLLAVFSGFITADPSQLDRANYARNYVPERTRYLSLGLSYLAQFSLLFSPDISFFCAVVSFITSMVALFSLRQLDDVTPESVLLLYLSQFFIYSFYLLKQAPATALATLGMVFFINKKWILSLISIAIALLFHESAAIVLFFILFFVLSRRKWFNPSLLVIAVLTFIFFSEIMNFLATTLANISPFFANQMKAYLGRADPFGEQKIAAAFKGFPFYVISVYLLWMKKTVSEKIKDYDGFLMLSFFISFLHLCTYYMTPAFRFSIYLYPLIFWFFVKVLRRDKSHYRKWTTIILVFSSTAFFTFRYLYLIFANYGGF